MRVLLTGATGFIGSSLYPSLVLKGFSVLPVVREKKGLDGEVVVEDINGRTEWKSALSGCDVVVHLAGIVHEMKAPLSEYSKSRYIDVNVNATLNLARQAIAAGVKRFIFISTIKVNGEGGCSPYTEVDTPLPEGIYAQSKWAAEQGLRKIEHETGLDVVIFRPPLVYGPGVGANFLRLITLIDRNLPLPFGGIKNHRSILYVQNFVEAIILGLNHEGPLGKTFMIDDGRAVSTPELIKTIACVMNKKLLLFSVPDRVLVFIAKVSGRQLEMQRLVNSLYVDSSSIRRCLKWSPRHTMMDGLVATIRALK